MYQGTVDVPILLMKLKSPVSISVLQTLIVLNFMVSLKGLFKLYDSENANCRLVTELKYQEFILGAIINQILIVT